MLTLPKTPQVFPSRQSLYSHLKGAFLRSERVEFAGEYGCAFEEELEDCCAVLLDLLDILDYNAPLYDSRILPTIWLKLTGAKDLHCRILEKENQVNSTRTANPNTFNPKTASIMFF